MLLTKLLSKLTVKETFPNSNDAIAKTKAFMTEEEWKTEKNVHRYPPCSHPIKIFDLIPSYDQYFKWRDVQTVYMLKLLSYRGQYHEGQQSSSDDSFHSPTVIPPSALNKPSIMKHHHRQWTCSHTLPRHSTTMVTLHDTLVCQVPMVEWRMDCETSMIPAFGLWNPATTCNWAHCQHRASKVTCYTTTVIYLKIKAYIQLTGFNISHICKF